MTSLVILLLVVLWGAVFGPAILRARQQTSPIASVGTFRRGMRALSRNRPSTSGRWVLMPKTPDEAEAPRKRAVARRRHIFVGLLGGSGASLVLGLIPSLHALLILHLCFDLVLAGFVLFLLQLKQRRPPKHAFRNPPRDLEETYLEVGQL